MRFQSRASRLPAAFGRRIAWLTLAAIVLAAAWLLWPLTPPKPVARKPAAGYAEAVSRLPELGGGDTAALHAGCETTALLHGRPTPRAIVLVHGLTNCPLQFARLADSLYTAGDNVLVPRVAHHGLADRMTDELARLTQQEMIALIVESVDIARGIGDTVVVAGLSSGGVMAAWAGQRLEGVHRAVVIAPTFGPPWGRAWSLPLLTRAALRLPNAFVWWDETAREELAGPEQCYPRFATRAIASVYRLGQDVARALDAESPRAAEIAVVTTESDRAIDLEQVDAIAAAWRRRGTRFTRVSFSAALQVPHDMIDPAQVGATPDLAYPVLLALIHGERPTADGVDITD